MQTVARASRAAALSHQATADWTGPQRSDTSSVCPPTNSPLTSNPDTHTQSETGRKEQPVGECEDVMTAPATHHQESPGCLFDGEATTEQLGLCVCVCVCPLRPTSLTDGDL